ncbi:MAG: hypothetical protein QOE65_1924 [Solirubrobacteraceae bacterium]|jgi:hypothetical protein|nr:hypothetical protein [Solirubrobacteraceae bacterium]
MRRGLACALAVAAALAGAAAPALAAYAPSFEAKVDPATPGSPSALTLTVTQAHGEGATRTEVVRFPPAFRFNPGFTVVGCGPGDEAAATCPDSSRIGWAYAEVEAAAFNGPVYFTPDFRILIYLSPPASPGPASLPPPSQKIEGHIRIAPDGWTETVLDDLPALSTTFSQVRIESSFHAPMLTPPVCGPYPVEARFTSHDGEAVARRVTVPISGCETPPGIAALRARPRGRALDVRWTLAGAGRDARLVVDRRARLGPWVRWARARTLDPVPAAAGPGRAYLSGLGPGRYRVTLTTRTVDGAASDFRRAQATIARP